MRDLGRFTGDVASIGLRISDGIVGAFVQNLRRGHYELGLDARHRLLAVFAKLALAI
ncbi:MAG: hypothetical protein ACRDTD_08980 [Pseudonocardiaceae bacterium]